MKYSRSPRDFSRAEAIFQSISRLEPQYRHSHLPNNGPAVILIVAYAAVNAVCANVDPAVAAELIPSTEAVLAAMLTCSHRSSRSHSHYFNHTSSIN